MPPSSNGFRAFGYGFMASFGSHVRVHVHLHLPANNIHFYHLLCCVIRRKTLSLPRENVVHFNLIDDNYIEKCCFVAELWWARQTREKRNGKNRVNKLQFCNHGDSCRIFDTLIIIINQVVIYLRCIATNVYRPNVYDAVCYTSECQNTYEYLPNKPTAAASSSWSLKSTKHALHTLVASLHCHCASIHSTDVNNNRRAFQQRKISYLHNYSNYFVFSSRFIDKTKRQIIIIIIQSTQKEQCALIVAPYVRSFYSFDRQSPSPHRRNGKREVKKIIERRVVKWSAFNGAEK